MIADRSLVKDPGRIVERIAPEFEKLLLAVTVGALGAKEKKAGEKKSGAQSGRGRKGPARRKTRAKAAATTYPSD
jgi:hypothetical protein